MTRAGRAAAGGTTVAGTVVTGAASAAAALAAYRTLRQHPPAGEQTWTRTNHRGELVTLLEGPAVAVGAIAAEVVGAAVAAPAVPVTTAPATVPPAAARPARLTSFSRTCRPFPSASRAAWGRSSASHSALATVPG